MERVKFYDGVLLFTLEVASYISNGNVYLLINRLKYHQILIMKNLNIE